MAFLKTKLHRTLLIVLTFTALGLSAAPALAWGNLTTQQTRQAGAGQVRVSAGWHGDGTNIYNDWRDCRVLWATGQRIDITWCGVWNGPGYKEAGANYTVHVLSIGGWEIYSFTGWMRTRVYPNGRYEFYGG
jgi:hypothetical protein